MKYKKIPCGNMREVADVFNHNMGAMVVEFQRLNRKVRKLERRNRRLLLSDIMFGAVAGFCFMELKQKAAELEEKLDALSEAGKEQETVIDVDVEEATDIETEIEEPDGAEGD